jgi:uracil DNA glycosylase
VIRLRFVEEKSIREVAAALDRGNHWYIATAIVLESVASALRTVMLFLHAKHAADYVEFLQRARRSRRNAARRGHPVPLREAADWRCCRRTR